MSEIEVKGLRCQDKGDLVNWGTLKQHKSAQIGLISIPCCLGMLFCKIIGLFTKIITLDLVN